MPSTVRILNDKKLIQPPKWLPDNVHYEVMMGSVAYGVSGDASDCDVYGFAIPPKEDVFPHLRGEIMGFGRQLNRFNVFDPHHIKDDDTGREYDLAIYNIVKYFALCMDNNPNMIDSLFVPDRCILSITDVGQMVRDRRKLFLHKGSWHKFKGYAFKQLKKLEHRSPSNEKRAADVDKHGYDTKYAYHIVRLLCEVEQIMIEHDLDIQKNREQLKSIRRGEWTLERIKAWFESKEKSLEGLYVSSTLQHTPDEDAIRQLLLDCLEHHYGSLRDAVKRDVSVDTILADLQTIIDRHSH